MSFKMQRVHLFHAEVDDKPGGVAVKLKKLAEAGAHLEYVYSQRSATKPGMGDLFVAPLHGGSEMAAARAAGRPGGGAPSAWGGGGAPRAGGGGGVTQAWEIAGINLHGLVMSVVGGRFIGYATFDSVADANKAATILAELGTA